MSDVSVSISGDQIYLTVDPSPVAVSIAGQQGPAGPVGGANTQVLFNDSNAAAGDSRLVWDKTLGRLILGAEASGGWSDVLLNRDAANTLAMRNGANVQMFRVYGTYTNSSNYERGFFGWTGSVLQIGTEAAGSGTGGRPIRFLTAGTNRWQIAGNGHISAVTANTYDIAGARNISADTGFYTPGFVSVGGTTATTGLSLTWDGALGGTIQSYATLPLRLNPQGNEVRIHAGGLKFQTGEAFLFGAANNTLEQRNGTNAQIWRLYRTWTDANNYERVAISWVGFEPRIAVEAAGTGTKRDMRIWTNASLHLGFGAIGTTQITFTGGDAGNALLALRPTDTALYSLIDMRGLGGDSLQGMFLQAGQNAGWIGADTITLRKRDNSVNYLVLNTTTATFGIPITGTGNVVEHRNGNNTQTIRLYHSYTDGSNYSRLGIYRSGTYGWILEDQAAGTGAANQLALSGFRLRFLVGGSPVWRVESTGAFNPEVNNSVDIGASGLAPRTIYASTSVVAPGVTTTTVLVSALPAGHPSREGMRAFVSDSTLSYTSANVGATVVGGGSNKVPVIYNGTNWIIG